MSKSKDTLIFLLSESKLDDSFPLGQFLIDGFHAPFKFDFHKNGRGIILYIREDIPARVLSHNFPPGESFFVEIIFHKKKWLISRTLDTFSTKYENILLLGDFNACADDETVNDFRSSYCLKSLIKQPTCFKNPENLSCIDLILTNKPWRFHSMCVLETGLSDFHRITVSVLNETFEYLFSEKKKCNILQN